MLLWMWAAAGYIYLNLNKMGIEKVLFAMNPHLNRQP